MKKAAPCASNDEPPARAAAAAPIHRPALLIQPYSVFCIVLVGELPTIFPTARSVKGECNGRFFRTPTG
ncbi:hypothetical protein DB771_04400 [Burkholderia sp. AU29985]|nr:hypothetical protein EGY28_18150 [Burkholderia dolosa]PRE43207.1 hypothetical protein C6P87_25565 [Burkholderia sp. AU12872]PUA78079.1 hypothetical protein DB771_04400 [Burkholderia sp. AU29985]